MLTASSCRSSREGANNQQYDTLPEALRTLSNSSDSYLSVWTDDGTAIMVPPPRLDLQYSYTATSIGIFTSCEAITNRCVTCDETLTYDNETFTTCRGGPLSDQAGLNFACPTVNTTVDEYHDRQYGAPTNGHIADIIDPATQAPLEGSYDDFLSWLAPSK